MKENEQKGGNKLEELFQIVAPLKGKPFVKFQLLMAAESLNLNKSLIEALSKLPLTSSIKFAIKKILTFVSSFL